MVCHPHSPSTKATRSLVNLCDKGHVRIHTRTPKNTTLHHPSMHSDNDTDPKHSKSRQVPTHVDQPRNCLSRLLRSVDALC